MKFKRAILVIGLLLALSIIVSGCGSQKAPVTAKKVSYPAPDKTIKIINVLPEGTPPDLIAKKVAGVMAQQTGWKFEFESAPGNNGGDAVEKVWNAPHDGYTVLGQTEVMLGLSVSGVGKRTVKDWTNYEMYQETSSIVVKQDSPYKTIEDLVNAAKAKPGTIKIGNPSNTSSFNYKVGVLEMVTGAKFVNVEYLGGVGMMDALMSGKVDALTIPMVLGMKELGDGKVRPLAVMDADSFNFGGNTGRVDSVAKYYPEYKQYLPLDAIQGFSIPADAPKDVIDTFGKAFENAMNSPEIQELIRSHDALNINIWGDNAKGLMEKEESNYAWLVKQFGWAKVDPQTLGIQKPSWVK